jgi:hypothetical protein
MITPTLTQISAYWHDRRIPRFELLTPDGWIVVSEAEYITAWNNRKEQTK